ncbi:MAG: class I SAM-dependent methyltransferase [Acidobacteriota bacterium]
MDTCVCCGESHRGGVAFRKNDHDVRKCPACGLGSVVSPRICAEEYYDKSYFDGGRADGYSDYAGSREVLRDQFAAEVGYLRSNGYCGGKLLEIGCAYGYFLDEVGKHFEEVYGIEICEDAVLSCRARGLTTVRRGAVSPEVLADVPGVDLVVMFDVIEHLEDPRAALRTAADKLVPGGHLVLTTGDFSSLVARLAGSSWRLMTPPQHLWFFTPKSLKSLAESAGLTVISVEHPGKKVPLGLMLYQLGRLAGVDLRVPGWAHKLGLYVNLFDAMRVVMRKDAEG